MAELFKFRCPACGKLLGVPPRKAGRAVHCPRCGTEQVVPHPADVPVADDADEGGEDAEAIDLGDLGIDLGGVGPTSLRPSEAPKATRPRESPDVSELVKRFLEVGSPEATPTDPDDEAADDEPIVVPRREPLAPGPVRQGGRGRGRLGGPRPGRDVVLPRTAVVAWSLFALLALGLSFVAGLMVGHYRWK